MVLMQQLDPDYYKISSVIDFDLSKVSGKKVVRRLIEMKQFTSQ